MATSTPSSIPGASSDSAGPQPTTASDKDKYDKSTQQRFERLLHFLEEKKKFDEEFFRSPSANGAPASGAKGSPPGEEDSPAAKRPRKAKDGESEQLLAQRKLAEVTRVLLPHRGGPTLCAELDKRDISKHVCSAVLPALMGAGGRRGDNEEEEDPMRGESYGEYQATKHGGGSAMLINYEHEFDWDFDLSPETIAEKLWKKYLPVFRPIGTAENDEVGPAGAGDDKAGAGDNKKVGDEELGPSSLPTKLQRAMAIAAKQETADVEKGEIFQYQYFMKNEPYAGVLERARPYAKANGNMGYWRAPVSSSTDLAHLVDLMLAETRDFLGRPDDARDWYDPKAAAALRKGFGDFVVAHGGRVAGVLKRAIVQAATSADTKYEILDGNDGVGGAHLDLYLVAFDETNKQICKGGHVSTSTSRFSDIYDEPDYDAYENLDDF